MTKEEEASFRQAEYKLVTLGILSTAIIDRILFPHKIKNLKVGND